MNVVFHGKNFDVTLDAATHEEIFNKVIDLQNSGLLENKCGCCGSENIYMRVRNVEFKDQKGKTKTAAFPEWKCRQDKCWASLLLHKNNDDSGKKGNMYKVAYVEKDGKRDYTTGGWVKYVKEDQKAPQKPQNNQQKQESNDEEPGW